jgi:eukaryotic translation initiation factor 2C
MSNSVVHIPGLGEVPTMLFGADVTHPAPGSGMASIASVVGSTDLAGGRYAARMGVQASKQEIISAMDVMCASLLREFLAKTGKKPEVRFALARRAPQRCA